MAVAIEKDRLAAQTYVLIAGIVFAVYVVLFANLAPLKALMQLT